MTDLVVKRGDTIELDVVPVLKNDGTVQDLTGLTLVFTAKDRITDLDGAAILSATTANSTIVITNAVGGLARVSVPAAQTAGFTDDRVLLWDLQLSDPAGRKKTLDSGKLRVVRDVTRA